MEEQKAINDAIDNRANRYIWQSNLDHDYIWAEFF